MMIFVFGSNLAGRHGKGAALYAKKMHGAEYGVGEGRTGNAYAIPTKDGGLHKRDLEDVQASIVTFLEYARNNENETFELTPVGCGLAGFNAKFIWDFIQSEGLPQNVLLSPSWMNDHEITA